MKKRSMSLSVLLVVLLMAVPAHNAVAYSSVVSITKHECNICRVTARTSLAVPDFEPWDRAEKWSVQLKFDIFFLINKIGPATVTPASNPLSGSPGWGRSGEVSKTPVKGGERYLADTDQNYEIIDDDTGNKDNLFAAAEIMITPGGDCGTGT